MLIYQDIFTGDELCSDSFPMKVVDGLIYEFTGKHCTRKEGEIILPGANASAEEMDEGTDETVERGVDIVLNHRLQNMTKIYGEPKQFTSWAKEYLKKIVVKLKELGKDDEYIAEFKKKIQAFIVSLVKKERFKTLDFFVPDSDQAADGLLCILEYRDVDGTEVPTLMLIKDGVDEIKC